MKASLWLNGQPETYPQDISDLEGLILFVMKNSGDREELIVDVKVDGQGFSEQYDHQARQIGLATIKNVQMITVTAEWFSRQFISQAAQYIDHVKRGFRNAIDLFRHDGREKNGYDMLASSLNSLSALKDHLKNVRDVVAHEGNAAGDKTIWLNFEGIADLIGEAQADMNPQRIANLLEEQVLPFLDEWKVAA